MFSCTAGEPANERLVVFNFNMQARRFHSACILHVCVRGMDLLRQKVDVGVYLFASLSSEYETHVALIRQKLELQQEKSTSS